MYTIDVFANSEIMSVLFCLCIIEIVTNLDDTSFILFYIALKKLSVKRKIKRKGKIFTEEH